LGCVFKEREKILIHYERGELWPLGLPVKKGPRKVRETP
jgi:hypothetical protein